LTNATIVATDAAEYARIIHQPNGDDQTTNVEVSVMSTDNGASKAKRQTKKANGPGALMFALSHPTRIAIIKILNTCQGSPKDMSRQLGEDLGNVSYHTDVLEECGIIELVRQRQVRGATEHFYRAKPGAFSNNKILEHIPPNIRRDLSDEELTRMVVGLASIGVPLGTP
jgi:DNA-binding transcriptional ArsR family regulator